uniref:NADH-ubiquinone oxidoreductase 21kDa subunit N-terminal domain-containing protein n=3 Tax=Cucumis sativus TaxID=3659 RepID=A0A0A0LT27_CUCSA
MKYSFICQLSRHSLDRLQPQRVGQASFRERGRAAEISSFSYGEDKMNTDITASTKPEYPVVDRNPPFTKVVGNFDTLDYLRFVTITGVSVTVGYLSGIKPGIRGPSMVTGGLIGLMGGFMYAYQNSAGRLMGFFPNDGEVARYKK